MENFEKTTINIPSMLAKRVEAHRSKHCYLRTRTAALLQLVEIGLNAVSQGESGAKR